MLLYSVHLWKTHNDIWQTDLEKEDFVKELIKVMQVKERDALRKEWQVTVDSWRILLEKSLS